MKHKTLILACLLSVFSIGCSDTIEKTELIEVKVIYVLTREENLKYKFMNRYVSCWSTLERTDTKERFIINGEGWGKVGDVFTIDKKLVK